MSPSRLFRPASALASMLLLTWCAGAQCLDWRTFPLIGLPEQETVTTALQVFDDGSGPALYLGQKIYGYLPSYPPGFIGIQRFDGVTFSDVGTGLLGRVDALEVFDDGSGPALYAGGLFSIPGFAVQNIARWTGTTWTPVGTGTNGEVLALHVHDDGSGPALYAAGSFTVAGSAAAELIAKWNGVSWSALGGGVPHYPGYNTAYALTSFDDGSGPALVVGGQFFLGGPLAILSQWKSGAWSALGQNPSLYPVLSLASWDDGAGPKLYAGQGDHVRRWNGQTWTEFFSQPEGIGALEVLDDGSGPKIFMGHGPSIYSGPTHTGVRRWDGTQLVDYNANRWEFCSTFDERVSALAMFDDGSGPRLYAGSSPSALGTAASSLSRWTGTSWESVQPHVHGLQGVRVRALHSFDAGSGAELYAAGTFCGADDVPTKGIARWSGDRWLGLVDTPYDVIEFDALEVSNVSGGNRLYAGGRGAQLWTWNESTWFSVAQGQSSDAILSLQKFGAYLYIGGSFTSLNSTSSPNLARLSANFVGPVGSGPTAGVNGDVNAMTTYNDGSGLALYAAGTFTSGGGVSMNRIGRFDGAAWSALGSGMDSLVDALVAFDDGSGPALFAAGTFTTAGGTPASCVARWNGTSWSAVGAGLNAQVLSLGVFDDGSGPALYAGGNFTMSGTTPVTSIARWNGTNWTQLGSGANGAVWSLLSYDDGTDAGPELFAGGEFHRAGGSPSELFAAWRGCEGAISKFCFGDGSVSTCPCSNQGSSGRGCNNSQATGGARMNAVGTTNPDTIRLNVAAELPNAATLVFQGDALLTSPQVFGDGLRCCGGSIKRLYATSAVAGTLAVPDLGQPSISARSAALGDPLTSGSVRCYQAWYRDASPTFCAAPSGNAWNLSNAVRIVW
jgi:hypothetical protein